MKRALFCLPILFSMFSYAGGNGYEKWLERRSLLIEDDSVARYYTFEGIEGSQCVLEDLSGSGGDMRFFPYRHPDTGEVYDDLEIVQGRWPEKKAVRLDRGWYEGTAVPIKNKRFSGEVWFRRNGPGSVEAARWKNGTIISVSGFWRGWRIVSSYEHSYTLNFSIGQPEGSATVEVTSPLPDNLWHHLAFTWDGTYMKVYINGNPAEQRLRVRGEDGRLEDAETFSGDYVDTDFPFRIGYSAHGTNSIVLDVDEIVLYNRVLTPEEIEKLGRGPSGVSETEVFTAADKLKAEGDYEGARAQYRKLKGLASYGREFALFSVAESYSEEKNYEKFNNTYEQIYSIPNLLPFYRIYGLFRQAEAYVEQGRYEKARELYFQAGNMEESLDYHVFLSRIRTADTYRYERIYSYARENYKKMLSEEEAVELPHQGRRVDLIGRLEAIEGLTDGQEEKNLSQKRAEWANLPGEVLYVCTGGSDEGDGTVQNPFASIQRAREQVRIIKEKGMPEGGIAVYLRGGSYFVSDSVVFDRHDSGEADAPVVYRSYPGEKARIIGGKVVENFRVLEDPDVLGRLPESSRGKVWVADLKSASIHDYGKLLNRGDGTASPAAMELIYNGRIMRLSRWPNEGWLRVAGLVDPEGDYEFRNTPYQKGKFVYGEDRPERWLEEQEVWLKGYMGVQTPYSIKHLKVTDIDTENRIIRVEEDVRWAHLQDPTYRGARIAAEHPYFAYNLLSEIEVPGEFFIDRENGLLYFYPPGDIQGSEIIVTKSENPLFKLQGVSNLVFMDLVFEGGRSHALEISGGNNNLVARSVIRNTGQWGVFISGGWNHSVVGCDIHDTGEGGVLLEGGDRAKLIPAAHTVENNHIYRFNRFCGGYRQAVSAQGVGQRVAHNVIHDSPLQAIYLDANDHVVEFNEIHDVVHEGRELGSIYIYGAYHHWRFLSRGNVIRNNFFHHISIHSSPNLTHGLNAIHFDSINGGQVVENNVFFRVPTGVSNPYPDNRLENNLFIEVENRGIGLSNRGTLFISEEGHPNLRIIQALQRGLNFVNYKQPPWSYRYPQLVNVLSGEKPIGWSRNNYVERNVNTGGRFMAIGRGLSVENHIRHNWDGDDPLFIDRESMDFRLRTGSPIFGLTGREPSHGKEIAGVYEDSLRASWPISRTEEDIGRYYKPEWMVVEQLAKTRMAPLQRVSPASFYEVARREGPSHINGNLQKEPWTGMDSEKTMVIEQHWDGTPKEGAKSRAMLFHDGKHLYLGVQHYPDPFLEGMPASAKKHEPLFEVAIETQHGEHSRGWWIDDMATGPIYSFNGSYDGRIIVNNLFGMPHAAVTALEESVELGVRILDDEKREWTAEMKIPLEAIGVEPSEAGRLSFNIGVWNKAGWFAWVATGSSIWRVENAGFITFE